MLLNDQQIKEFALAGMIDPFIDHQVRSNMYRVISYGLSSAGYDIRCTSKFKIFRPVYDNSGVVDPKDFRAELLEDFENSVCFIPPNSYVLTHSVERFVMPKNVAATVVGKSTYARCFSGNTKVALVDRTKLTLEQMAKRSEKGERFWGYGVNSKGLIIVTELIAPRYIGKDSLLEIVLDNNEVIQCTPDHKFLMRNGCMLEAQYLRPGTSIMPLYRRAPRGYEAVYQPTTGRLYPTHRLADEWNLRNEIYLDVPDSHRHHIDGDRRNNKPINIVRMDAKSHIKMHNERNFGEDFDPIKHSNQIRNAYIKHARNKEWLRRYKQQQQDKAYRFWHDDVYADIRDRVLSERQNMSEETREKMSASQKARYIDSVAREERGRTSKEVWARSSSERRQKQAEIMRSINIRSEITEETVETALSEAGSMRGAARLLNCDRSVFRRFPDTVSNFKLQTMQNHKVIAIREIPGNHDVYCLSAPETGNFALQSGIFVSNCGIIVNVTPLEPGWTGYLTIEISNASPLPAKIYAYEGIAQVLFHQIETPSVSYADRDGKYQDQPAEVVTAKL